MTLRRCALLLVGAACTTGSPSSPIGAPTVGSDPVVLRGDADAALDASTALEGGSAWSDRGVLAFDSELRVDAPVALDVRMSPFGCFQVSSIVDDHGEAWVMRDESGAFCRDCLERVSLAAGGGLFVLPSGARASAPDGGIRVRFRPHDCATMVPLDLTDAGALAVRTRPLMEPTRGVVAVRFIVTPASIFHPAERDLGSVLTAVNAELASAAVTVTLDGVERVTGPSDAKFSRAATTELEAMRGALAQAEDVVPVFLAGCLQLVDDVLRTTGEPEGYTAHIPGGAGSADGIFIRGSLCGTPQPTPVEWSAPALGRILAHEIAHYLGLYHAIEADGTADTLDDTDANNLMNYRPSLATAKGLSASQGRVMRRHPFVRSAP